MSQRYQDDSSGNGWKKITNNDVYPVSVYRSKKYDHLQVATLNTQADCGPFKWAVTYMQDMIGGGENLGDALDMADAWWQAQQKKDMTMQQIEKALGHGVRVVK